MMKERKRDTNYLGSIGFILLACVVFNGLPAQAADDFASFLKSENIIASREKEPGVVSLKETLEKTYMQNANLDAARAGLRATDETVAQAISEWRPSLSVQGVQETDWKRPIGSSRNRRASGNQRSLTHTTQYTATLQQNIFAGGGTIARVGEAKSNVLAGRYGLIATEQQTLFDAITAHLTVVSSEVIVGLRQKNVEFLKTTFEETKARHAVGLVSRSEVMAAEAGYKGAIADLKTAIGNLESAKASYLQQVGSPAHKLNMAKVLIALPKTYEDAIKGALVHSPALMQARYQVDAANYEVRNQQAGLLPSVVLEGDIGNSRIWKGQDPQDHRRGLPSQRSTDLSVSATVNVPVYSQGKVSSQVRQAYQNLSQQKVLFIQAERQVRQDVKTAWETVVAQKAAVINQIAQVKAQKVAVEGVTEEARVGLKSILDVLTQEGDLIQAQQALVNAQQQLISACYQLLQAMGKLTARNLKLNVKYYNPETYYDEHADAWIKFWEGDDYRYVKDESKNGK